PLPWPRRSAWRASARRRCKRASTPPSHYLTWRKPMRSLNWKKTSLLFALTTLLCACATDSAVRPPVECPALPEIPETLEKRKPDFYERMRNFCCESDEK